MVAFSLAFLLPTLLAQTIPALARPPLWALLPGAASVTCLLVPPWRRLLPALTAGAVLFLARTAALDHASEAAEPPGMAVPVVIEGVVSRPPFRRGDRLLIPMHDGPVLALRSGASGPLPGTRLRAMGRLEANGRVITVSCAEAITVLSRPDAAHLPALLESARRRLGERLSRGVSPRAQGHLRALLLGERALTPEDRSRFARTGTLHLFAVSGLHLAVFLGLLRRGLGPWSLPMLSLILFYASLTGFRSPMGRAFILAAAGLVGQRLGRHARPGRHLLLSLTVLLAWNPASVRDPGCLLSFTAFGGIQFLARPLLDRSARDPLAALEGSLIARAWRLSRAAVLVSCAAFLGSLPVMVTIFRQASWTALPGSVLLGPCIPILLVLGALLILLPGFPPAVLLVELVVHLLDAVTRLLDVLPWSPVWIPRPYVALLIAFVLLLVMACVRVARAQRLRPVLGMLMISMALLLVPCPVDDGLYLLQARRGSALLVVSRTDRWLLDCGPREARVADQLLDHGISRLDGVIVSHDQEDHAGGLADVLDRVGTDLVCFPPEASPGTVLRDAERRVLSRGARLRGRETCVTTLWPVAGGLMPAPNDRSLVVQIETPRWKALVLGDVESRALVSLLELGSVPACDILVAPHHGAHNRGLMDLLLRCAPSRVWISARAGFPDEGSMLLIYQTGLPFEGTWGGRAIRAR